jgi:hypothetical protein
MHIQNLSNNRDIFLFTECYAMEKIHGTSAHVIYSPSSGLTFFSGRANHNNFVDLFNQEDLRQKFIAIFPQLTSDAKITVYGEAYGGKLQGMSHTYGTQLMFIVFDVQVENLWLSVPQAEDVAIKLGLEFVSYRKIPVTIEALTEERNKFSVQGERNGIPNKKREGIVIRPLVELTKNNGDRVISKYKNEEFSERKSKADTTLDPERQQILQEAEDIAEEWVTAERLKHVLDKLPQDIGMEQMQDIMKAMIEDITREGQGQIVDSKEARKSIGKKTVTLFKQFLQQRLENTGAK